MKTRIQRRTRDTFLMVLLVPILLGAVSLWAEARHRESIAWVSHTQKVLAQIDSVLLQVTSAESAHRSFLLTGEQPDLTAYNDAVGQARGAIRELRESVQDNATERANVRELEAAVTQRFERLAGVLQSLHDRRFEISGSVTSSIHRGGEMMHRIRQISSRMQEEENALLVQRMATRRRTTLEINAIFFAAALANVALLYLAYQLIRQYGLDRDVAEIEIRKLNHDLERRVRERTAELQASNERLSRSNEDLSRFAYIASHDLQEPLRTVGSYAGLLGRRYEGKLDEQADKYIRFIVEGAKRMQTMVQDLLVYSRAGTQVLKREPLEMESVLLHARENLHRAIVERGATIAAGPLPRVFGDRGALTTVLQNLLANASEIY